MSRLGRIKNRLARAGNIPVLTTSEMISNTGWNMQMVVWQPYLLSLGASIPNLGALQSGSTLFRGALLLTTGRIADSSGRKRLMILASLLTTAGMVFAVVANHWLLVIPTMILWTLGGSFWEPAFRAMIAESVDPKNRGTAFGLLGLTWFLPGLYAPAIAGYLGEILSPRAVIMFMILTESTALAIITFGARETLEEQTRHPSRASASIRAILREARTSSEFYIAAIMQRFQGAMGEGIFLGMLVTTFGFDLLQLGLLANVYSAITSLLQIPMGKMSDRYGRKTFLVLSGLVKATAFVGYFLSNTFPMILLFHGINASSDAMYTPAFNAYLTELAPASGMATKFGNLQGIMALLTFPAPLLGSQLFRLYGFQAPVLTTAMLAAATTIAFTRLRKE